MRQHAECARGKSFLLYSAAAITLLSTSGPVLAQDASGASVGVGDIVVTARRKEERNQDVPVAVTAFGNERMREMNIVDTQSLQSSVPSLIVGANGQGSRDVQSPTIRGQGATFQASPGVAVYMAEVPLPSGITLSSQGAPGQYLDLQNVQVLKGPQGTLFGRNTTGGAVLLQPNKPTNKMEGYVQVQGGNYNDREVQAVVNVPIIDDKLMVRVAGEIVDRDGFTRDIAFNKDRDDKHYWTGRIGVTWRPTDKIENYLMVYNTWSRNNGVGSINEVFNTGALGSSAYNFFCDDGVTTCADLNALTTAQNARGPRKVAFSVDSFAKTEVWSATDTLDINLTDNLTLRNIVNYAELNNYYSYDGDGTISSLYDQNPFTARTRPKDDIKQYSEELQLQGNAFDKKLEYVVGAFYFKNEPNGRQFDSSLTASCGLTYTQLGLCLDPGPTGDGQFNPFATTQIAGVTQESYAAYAQGTYDLGGFAEALNGLRLTLGYRYTWDKLDGFSTTYRFDGVSPYVCGSDNSLVADPSACRWDVSLESERPTWTAGLDYKLRPDLLLYGKVSKGYKAGGVNTFAVFTNTRSFGPEEVTAYEIGLKSDFSVQDMPVRLNVDVFQTDYEKIQRSAPDFNPTTFASGAVTISSAEARIRGVEIETVIKPTKYLELGANYSYLDAEYTKYPYLVGAAPHEDCTGTIVNPGSTADMSCLPMQYLADNIANVYGRVNFTDNVSLFVNYAWTDDQYVDALFLPKNAPFAMLESYGVLNASFDWTRISGSNVDLSIFATNLTDEVYRTSDYNVFNGIGVAAALYGEPRMVGARLRYNWGG